jgi:tetratricopeptide (TPR) repeat protein
VLAVLLATLVVTSVTADSPDATAAFERGRRLYELGTDLPAARTALDDAIRLKPDYADAYLYRALVISHDQGLGPARADFDKALELAPDQKEAHRFYGEALLEAGALDDAEQHFDRALALDPDYGDVLYFQARLYRRRGQLDRAIPLLERWGKLDPQATSHHSLGEIFLEKGDVVRAAKEFEADLAQDATCYESRLNLAGLRLEAGAWDQAREEYETSLGYHPADARALSGLGRAYLALGDYERAVGTLRSAQDLAPEDDQVKDALAQARGKLRVQYGWPFAVIPAAIAIGLGVYIWSRRRKGA